jgi:hypothetical protein
MRAPEWFHTIRHLLAPAPMQPATVFADGPMAASLRHRQPSLPDEPPSPDEPMAHDDEDLQWQIALICMSNI